MTNLRKVAGRGLVMMLATWLLACSKGGGGDAPGATLEPVPEPPASSEPESPANPVEKDRGPFLLDGFGLGSFEDMRYLVHPAVDDNPLAAALIECTVMVAENDECSLRELPLIGMEVAAPSVADVMERVLVSDDWMALRFRQLLAVLPAELRLMTRSLTAVVISRDIRPSFYTAHTGAIYLDPRHLWLTRDERLVIDTAPDFRSTFGQSLQFVMLARYVRNNEPVNPPEQGDRTIEDIKYRMASLLFHELGHAGDFFSPDRIAGIEPALSIHVAARVGDIPSEYLAARYPLRSTMLKQLARVSFYGWEANDTQKAYTSEDVGAEFPTDYANDYYGYATQQEDLAMLLEEVMMLYSFGVDRDVAVTNLPPDGSYCDRYIVAWGQRNRVIEPAVKTRALFVLSRVLPEVADQVAQSLDAEAPPTPMQTGVDWCTNRELDGEAAARSLGGDPRQQEVPAIERLRPYL